jgi:hypothetical protein
MAVQHPCTAVVKYSSQGRHTFEICFNHSPGVGRYSKFSKDDIDKYCEKFLYQYEHQKAEDAVVHVMKHSALRVLDENYTPKALHMYSYDQEVTEFKSRYSAFKDALHNTGDGFSHAVLCQYKKLLKEFWTLKCKSNDLI